MATRITLALLLIFTSFAASAELMVSNTWIREAPPNAKVLAGYMDLMNHGDKAITITADVSDDFERIEIHDMSMDKGMMKMKKLDTLEIPPHGTVKLQPGGMHMMLINPKKRLRDGDQAMIAIKLDNGERKELLVKVKKVHGEGHSHSHSH